MSSLPCSKHTAQPGSVRVQSLHPWSQGSTKSAFSPTPCPYTAILVNEIALFYQPWLNTLSAIWKQGAEGF